MRTIKGRGLVKGEFAIIEKKKNGLLDIQTFPNKRELLKYKQELKREKNNKYQQRKDVKDKRRIRNIKKSIKYWTNKIKSWKSELNRIEREVILERLK